LVSSIMHIDINAQTWGNEDYYNDNYSTRQQNWDNPYQDPNYYPTNNGYRGCPPPRPSRPVSCGRNVVVVAPPPSYCAPVVVVPRPFVHYRPYTHYHGRRHCGYRGWR